MRAYSLIPWLAIAAAVAALVGMRYLPPGGKLALAILLGCVLVGLAWIGTTSDQTTETSQQRSWNRSIALLLWLSLTVKVGVDINRLEGDVPDRGMRVWAMLVGYAICSAILWTIGRGLSRKRR